MSDPASLIQTIASRWNAGLAEQAVREITLRFWAGRGRGDEELLALADRMRQVLKQELGRSAVPAEQMRLLEMSYKLEQGLGRRDVALSLAKNIRHLAERKADALHQVRAAFLLADAWHMVSALPFAIDWSKRGFAEAKPLEQRGQGGRPYRVMYAAQEVQLALRLALQGGMFEQAGRLLADAVRRYEAAGDTAARAEVLAVQSQVHMLQGRWAESVEAARLMVGTHNEASGMHGKGVSGRALDKAKAAAGLWAGARSASRLGDLVTARTWIDEAIQTAGESADIGSLTASLFSKASILLLPGEAAAALGAADQAVELGSTWRHEILRRWAMLERCWVRLAAGRVDVDEIRATAEAFGKFGAGALRAEAHYALYHSLKATGQDAQVEYQEATEQFEQLKMDWQLARAKAGEPLVGNRV